MTLSNERGNISEASHIPGKVNTLISACVFRISIFVPTGSHGDTALVSIIARTIFLNQEMSGFQAWENIVVVAHQYLHNHGHVYQSS